MPARRASRPVARFEPPIEAALPREPQPAGAIEYGRVQVRVGRRRGKREEPHRARTRVHADDRVEPAVGDPRRAVGADDDAVGCRSGAERRMPRPAGAGIEPAELAARLRRVPDAAVAGGCDVVRVRARRNGVLAQRDPLVRRRLRSSCEERDEPDKCQKAPAHGTEGTGGRRAPRSLRRARG